MFAAVPLIWKIVAPLGTFALLVGLFYGWQEYQQSIGRAEKEAEYLSTMMKQQQEAMGLYIVNNTAKLQAVEQSNFKKDRFYARLRQLDRERAAHDATPPTVPNLDPLPQSPACTLDAGLVRDLNARIWVLNDTAAERAGAAGGASAEPALSGVGSDPAAEH